MNEPTTRYGPTANPKAQGRMRDRAKDRERQLKKDLVSVMSTHEGRRLMLWIVEDVCGLSKSTFTGNNKESDIREGKRHVAIELRESIRTLARKLWTLMQNEDDQAQEEEAVHREDALASALTEQDA